MLLTLLTIVFFLIPPTDAFPKFTGGCASGISVGETHLDASSLGLIEDYRVNLFIGGRPVTPKKALNITFGQNLTIRLNSTGGQAFRGFQMRISRGDINTRTWMLLANDTNVQLDQYCLFVKAGGLCHNSRKNKTSAVGIVKIPNVTYDILLEVTIVVENHDGISIWYKSDYILNAVPIRPCFPGTSSVIVEGKGKVKISGLSLGDRVMVSGRQYEPVYSFGHYDNDLTAEYLRICTRSANLEISKDHMVSQGQGSFVPASMLNIGDHLTLVDGTEERITSINTVSRKGAFAPFTPSGSVIVDDILVSNFVAFQDSGTLRIAGISTGLSWQWLAHSFELPHRLWCSYCEICKNERYIEGISSWVYIPYQFTSWFTNLESKIVMIMTAFPAILLVCLLGAISNFPIVVIGIATFCAMKYNLHGRKSVKYTVPDSRKILS
jgi:Hint module